MSEVIEVDLETPYVDSAPAGPNLAKERNTIFPRSPRRDSSSPHCKWLSWGCSTVSCTAWAAHTNHRWRLQISERCSLSNAIDDNLCCHVLFGEAASTASAFIGWVYPWPFLACLLFLIPLGILNATVPEDSAVPLVLNRVANALRAAYSLLPGCCNLSYFSLAYLWAVYLAAIYVRKPLLRHRIRKVSNCSASHRHK